jgi:phenylacetate-CoA ligase
MDKQGLIAANSDIHTTFRFPRLFSAETSGTSGVALGFKRDEQWDSVNRAHVARGYRRFGVQPWDRNGYLWGFDIRGTRAMKTRALDFAQNRFRLFSYSDDELQAFTKELESAAFLGGYSSMVYEVAKILVSRGLSIKSLRMVKGTSESILDVHQRMAIQAFGRRITSEYGSAETGIIAFDCPEGSMHINIEDVVVEVESDGAIIVTNLVSRSFPIIRYRLGDSVKLSSTPCICGRSHPVLLEVLGRQGATVLGASGKYPALTFYYVFKNIALTKGVLLNYRAIQGAVGSCTLLIEGESNRVYHELIVRELEKYFGTDLRFTFEYVTSFPRGSRKAQYFESTIS